MMEESPDPSPTERFILPRDFAPPLAAMARTMLDGGRLPREVDRSCVAPDFGATLAEQIAAPDPVRLDRLKPYQMAALEEATRINFARQCGRMYVMPPGFGKTYLICALGAMYLRLGFGVVFMSITKLDAAILATLGDLIDAVDYDTNYVCMLHHNASNWRRKLDDWYRPIREAPVVFLIDEVHLLNKAIDIDRVMRTTHQYTDSILSELHSCAATAHIYLFTATPVVHNLVELRILNLLQRPHTTRLIIPFNKIEFDARFGPENRRNLVGIIGAIRPFVTSIDLPGILPALGEPVLVEAPMTMAVLDDYLAGYSFTLQTYLSGAIRAQVVSEVGEHKVACLIAQIKSMRGRAGVVYCRFINELIEQGAEALNASGVRYVILSARHSAKYWTAAIDQFNSPENTEGQLLQAIIIGPAARVGMSFINATFMICMAPPTNYSELIQVASRARRQNSLMHLAPEARAIELLVLVSEFDIDTLPEAPHAKMAITYERDVANKLLNESRNVYDQMAIILRELNIMRGGADENGEGPWLSEIELLSFI